MISTKSYYRLRDGPVHESQGQLLGQCPLESFCKTLKVERLYQLDYRTRDEAKWDIVLWIEGFYNRQRLHSSVDYRSPASAEASVKAA